MNLYLVIFLAVTAESYKLFGFHSCSTSHKSAVLDALTEKTTIMSSDSVFHPKWNHQGTIEYFGSPYDIMKNGHRERIESIAYKLQSFNNGWWFQGHQLRVFCGNNAFLKPPFRNFCEDSPGLVHLVRNYDDVDGVIFCDG